MARPFEFSVDEYYHIYNRGTEKRKIFLDNGDYQRFIFLLYACNASKTIHLSDCQGSTLTMSGIFEKERGKPLTDIGAYCLMPNHFHLLVREQRENGISLFMQKLSTAYTMYFNKKNVRTGSLFQGRFKATHANTDEHLKYLFAYIHLNPIKLMQDDWKEKGIKNANKARQFLREYPHSSYLDYAGEARERSAILNQSAFPDYFSSHKCDFKHFINDINDWLDYRPEEIVKVQP